MRKLILAAIMLGATAAHAEDYHKATTFEQTKAACEFFADSLRGREICPIGALSTLAHTTNA